MGLEWEVQSFNINSYHGVSNTQLHVLHMVRQYVAKGMSLATCKLHADASYICTGSLVRICVNIQANETQPENQTVINCITYPMPDLQWLYRPSFEICIA